MQEQRMQVLLGSVRKLLRRGATPNLRKALAKIHPADIAHLFLYLDLKDQTLLLSLISDKSRAADVLSELDWSEGAHLLEKIDRETIIAILQEMADDDIVELLRNMPDELAEEILSALQSEHSDDIEQLLGYDEDTAGGIMSTDVFSLDQNLSVSQAIDALQGAEEFEMVFYVYVTDEHNHLVGVLSLRQLLTVPPSTCLKDIMTTDVIRVRTDMDQEEVAGLVAKYNILGIPVVDEIGKLMGIVTVDDVIDVMREEANEDIFRMAGTSQEELMYGNKAFQVARLRLPWLLTTLCGGVLTGFLMWVFRATLEQAISLISFIPVITGMGGNVGGQTSTIVVRGFATGRIDFSMLRKIFFRELRVGLIMGSICGMTIAAVAYVWHHNLYLGLVVGVAMAVAISVAACMGVLAASFFKKVGIDPAIAASPFVQTVNDITGILIYFSTATFFLVHLT
ncbi:magnesium transporter [Geopsychrobacter electrodiphilus]|uniref:magnesium transporter n=1 Tax=Geopsychrobacter electrodiphilus TaxID=225196 RepID=UPI00036B27C5|nr:magnesium transporter [Geopsychrobacter electrodiphilus]